MSIPDFQSVMLPVLKTLSLGEVVSTSEVVEQISDKFNLTETNLNSTFSGELNG